MELRELQEQVRMLSALGETEAPVVSVYLNLRQDAVQLREFTKRRVTLLKESLPDQQLPDFRRAMERIGAYLAEKRDNDRVSLALFAREGRNPFFLALQFMIAVPDMVTAGPLPRVYPLVELKDNYHRFVVAVMGIQGTRIVEIDLGEVTKQFWMTKAGAHAHVRQTSTKQQNNLRREVYDDTSIADVVKALDRVMSAGGHTHLLLAGECAWRFRNALPHHLSAKFVDVVDISRRVNIQEILAASIAIFVQQEECESQEIADRLVREIRTDGLAVAGTVNTLHALKSSAADVLVLAQSFDPESRVKEEMVRLAVQHRTSIEVVQKSEELDRLGGVGCLLRYRASAPSTIPGDQSEEYGDAAFA